MISAAAHRTFERWLRELTSTPVAAGREDRVVRWVEDWVRDRSNLRLRRDGAGNLIITRTGRGTGRPIYFTAHMDHPAFVVRRPIDDREIELEFRGGVQDPYFEDAAVEIFDDDDGAHAGRVIELKARARPFKRVRVRLARPTGAISAGDVGRWRFRGPLPRVTRGMIHTHACDDLAGVAAALSALEALRSRRAASNVGVLLTRAEEIGFIGAIAASKGRSVPRTARLICLENSRSFPESPIGGGPILRVGDKESIFDRELTGRIDAVMRDHATGNSGFRFQRRLMPGGTCEATVFGTYGYESTCICLPLGNYHNMRDIDAVRAGRRPALVGPEFISLADYRGLVEMLVVCSTRLDTTLTTLPKVKLEKLLTAHRHVLDG